MSVIDEEFEELNGQIHELENDIAGIAEQYADLEQKLAAVHRIVGSAVSDLRAIDEVPFGQVPAYVEAVVTVLRQVFA